MVTLLHSYRKVTLHGLGASIVRTVSLAQSVQSALHDQVELRPTTTTVTLVDDIIPDDMVMIKRRQDDLIMLILGFP